MKDKFFIGISGKAFAGKTSFAYAIRDELDKLENELPFYKVSFADKLREITAMAFDLPVEKLRDSVYKETVHPYWKITPRKILQEVGTGFRNIDKDFWIKAVLNNFENGPPGIYVNDDSRYINEANAIRKINGIVVRIERSQELRPLVTNPIHPSEIDLDEYDFDYIIDNNGPIENLNAHAKKLISFILGGKALNENKGDTPSRSYVLESGRQVGA